MLLNTDSLTSEPKTSSVYAFLEKPSMVDYPKHFAAVFFVSGCNFTCGFCHNAKLADHNKSALTWSQLEDACELFKGQWVNGVVITGGEPTCTNDLPGLIRFFKDQFGFKVKLDTNGSNPERLAECLSLVDYVAMDVKCGLSAYPGMVGFNDTERIQQSIELIQAQAKDYEFRTTVIDSIHTDEQMDQVRRSIEGSKRFALQAFIPREELPDKEFRSIPRTTSSRLQEIRDRMEACADEIIVRG